MTEDSGSDQTAVDVFTHSSTGFPGAWTEDEITVLLNAWQDVLESSRSTTRRLDVAQKILKRLRNVKDFRKVEKDDIKKQLRTLRTEYKVYQGLLKIGIKTYRAPCVNQLEQILDKIPMSRRRLDSTDGGAQLDGVSEDSDYSRRLSVSYEGENEVRNQPRNVQEENRGTDEVSNQKPRVRFQKRMNFQRLIRVMVGQQQTLLDHFDKLFQSLESSNGRLVTLMENLVLQKTDVGETPREEKADSA